MHIEQHEAHEPPRGKPKTRAQKTPKAKTLQPTHTTHLITTRDRAEIFVEIFKMPEARGVPLVLCDGLGCDGFIWKYFVHHFKFNHPIIHWHYRGHGKSPVPRDLDSVHINALVGDLEEVLGNFTPRGAVLAAHSMGVQIALEAYAQLNFTFKGLMLLNGGYENPIKHWHKPPERHASPGLMHSLMRVFFEPLMHAMAHYPELSQPVWQKTLENPLVSKLASLFEVNGRSMAFKDFKPYFEHLYSMQAGVFARAAMSLTKHSAAHILPKIEVPTLIIGGYKDTFFPHFVLEDMHQSIPKSEFYFMKEGTHTTPLEYPDYVNLRVEKFLGERVLQF
jgi:pimeloyl-ACP methyl ester carboxylesterase